MRRKALHTIVVMLILSAAVCAECPGSPWPVRLPPNANFKAVASTRGTPMPMPIPPIASAQAKLDPGTPMPMPIPPTEVRS